MTRKLTQKQKKQRFKQIIIKENRYRAAKRRDDKISEITIKYIAPTLGLLFVLWYLLKRMGYNISSAWKQYPGGEGGFRP